MSHRDLTWRWLATPPPRPMPDPPRTHVQCDACPTYCFGPTPAAAAHTLARHRTNVHGGSR